jgi:hypothetical protein
LISEDCRQTGADRIRRDVHLKPVDALDVLARPRFGGGPPPGDCRLDEQSIGRAITHMPLPMGTIFSVSESTFMTRLRQS